MESVRQPTGLDCIGGDFIYRRDRRAGSLAAAWFLLVTLFAVCAICAFPPVPAEANTAERAGAEVFRGRVPLNVDWGENRLEIAPVTFGVPFPRGAIHSLEHLRVVTEEGEPVPAQMEATATWDGPAGPIRWVLLSMNVERGRTYALEYGSDVKAYNFASDEGIRLEDGPDVITVTTGPMRAEVSKVRPTLLDAVYLDVDGDGRFSAEEAIVTPAAAAAHLPVVIDGRGECYVAGGADLGLKVEVVRSGPIEVAIRREGWYVGADGTRFAQFVTYTHFFAEHAAVRHDHTFVVAFDSTRHQVRDIRLSVPLAVSAEARAEFATSTGMSGDLVAVEAGRAPVSLVQSAHDRWKLISLSSAERIAQGRRAGGWFGLSDQRWGAYAGWRDFWQQYPGELEAANGVLHLHLWSSREGSVLDFTPSVILGDKYPGDRIFFDRFYAGGLDRWTQAYGVGKTHNVWINFFAHGVPHGAGGGREEAAALTQAWLNMPVLALASPEWNTATEAFGRVHPENRERFPELEAALDALLHRKRWMQERFEQYGWIDYGDAYYRRNSDQVLWRRWASMFYGWPNVAPLLYLRSGRREAWDYHRINTRHIIDIDIGHLESAAFGKRRGGRYGGNGGIVHYAAEQYGLGPDSHVRFMYLDYYINGNLRAWEVAGYFVEDQYNQLSGSRVLREYQGRTSGGTLRLFSEAYEATWKPEYLQAMVDVAETFYREWAERGFTQYDDVYKNEGKLKYYQLTGDERMLNLFLNDMRMLVESRDPLSGRLPRPDGRGNTMWGLAHAYFFTGDEAFRDYLYWQVGNALTQMHTALDPAVGPESVGDMRRDFTGPPEQGYHATMGVQFPTAMLVMAEAGLPFPYLLATGRAISREDEGNDAVVLHGNEVTIPALGRPLRVYFNLPEGSEGAALRASTGVRLYDPSGTLLEANRPVGDWIELPPDRPGLWSIEAVDLYTAYTLEVRNIPPFFAFDEPARYFEPEIPWIEWRSPKIGDVVHGTVPLTFTVRVPGGGTPSRVRVFVNDRLLYDGDGAPRRLTLDTLELPDGEHDLRIVVTVGERVEESRTRLLVKNTWTFHDPLLVLEFFGTLVDNSKTSEASGGWRHRLAAVPDGPHDTSRMVRAADSTEYLVWSLPEPGLSRYQVVVFAHDDAVDALASTVHLAVRREGDEAWTEVDYASTRAGITLDGWHKVILAGEIDPIATPVRFRLLLEEGHVAADHLQISEVTFSGLRR